jgi:hypothetical protein
VHGAYQLSLALFAAGLVDADCVRYARAADASGPRRHDLDELRRDALARNLISPTALTQATS